MRHIALSLLLLLAACGQAPQNAASYEAAPVAASPKMAKMDQARIAGASEQSLTELSEPVADAQAGEVQRFIAMRHSLAVETPAEEMQKNFDATIAHCSQIKCQLLSANFNRQTQYSAPSASISARVPPRSLQVFLTGLAKSGEILEHHRESEDKTDAVIDAEARIKNLTELRDRLREMLNKRTGSLKDIIEVERELANTQAQLESVLGMRKVLAQETEMVAVNIEFRAKQSVTETGFFAPVLKALDDAGQVMMQSLANVITFIVAALPWLLLGIPFLLVIKRLWRWIKSKHT